MANDKKNVLPQISTVDRTYCADSNKVIIFLEGTGYPVIQPESSDR